MKIQSTLFSLFAAALLLAGCSASKLLALAGQNDSYRKVENISYGADPRHKMDIFLPQQPAPSRCAILFFYGGSWQDGARADYHFAAQGLIRTGCVVAIADYRLYPAVSYPAFIEDSAKAFVWLKQNAKVYDINPANIYLAGHSAGAYNAAMLALHPRYLNDAGGSASDIRGVIGIAGPYDFLPFTDKNIIALFSTAPEQETQPIYYANSKAPPFLLLTGTGDTKVLPKNSHNLAKALKDKTRPVTIKTYPDVGHVGIALALSPVFAGDPPVLEDIEQFIRETEEN